MEIITGFFMGILGSFHCLGMCGPIVMAIPPRNDSRISIILDSLLYNTGRTLTYILLGFIVGIIGSSVSLAGYQKGISIFSGILLLIIVLIPKRWENVITDIGFLKNISLSFKNIFSKIIGKKTAFSKLSTGLLNGLLPCGLVYTALAASLASGTISGAMTFMLFFGLGTIPLMAALFVLKSMVSLGIRRKINKLIPAGIAIVAIVLIMRGMSLGIPYISPVLPDHVINKAKCCE